MHAGPGYPGWDTGLKQKYRRKRVLGCLKNLAAVACIVAVLAVIAYVLSVTADECGRAVKSLWGIFS